MVSRKIARTATEAVRIIWVEDFFKSWSMYAKIETFLSNRGNHFSTAELATALKRAKFLTRRGPQGKYEYIQKYPYVAEKPVTKVIKKGKK